MSSNDGPKNARGHGSRCRRNGRRQAAAQCTGTPASSSVPEIRVTPCAEEVSQHGEPKNDRDSISPVDDNHLAPPLLLRHRETSHRSFQAAGKTRVPIYSSERRKGEGLYLSHIVSNLSKDPSRSKPRLEDEVPSQDGWLTDPVHVGSATDQGQPTRVDQATDRKERGLQHGMSKNAWRRHCKKLQSQGLATKSSTVKSVDPVAASGGEDHSSGPERLLLQGGEDVKLSSTSSSSPPQTAPRGGSNVSVQSRPQKITVAYIEELARSMKDLHSASPLGGHRQWGSRNDKHRRGRKGKDKSRLRELSEQTSKIELSTQEGFIIPLTRGTTRNSRYKAFNRVRQHTSLLPSNQFAHPSTQQPAKPDGVAPELSEVRDSAKTKPRAEASSKPSAPRATLFKEVFKSDTSNQTPEDEDDMSRYSIQDLQTYGNDIPPASREFCSHAKSIIERNKSLPPKSKQRFKQIGRPSPDPHYSTDPGSLTDGTSARVADTVDTPTSYLTSRDVNQGLSNTRRSKKTTTSTPRGKWVSQPPPMTPPNVENTPKPAPTIPAPSMDATKRTIIVNLPSSAVSSQVPSQVASVVEPSNNRDTSIITSAQPSQPPQSALAPEPSDKQDTSTLKVAESSSTTQKPMTTESDNKNDTGLMTVAQPTLQLLPPSAKQTSNDNDDSSMAVAQPCDVELKDVASVDSAGKEQKLKVASQQTQEVTSRKGENSPKIPAENEVEQPKAQRNSNWPSKESLKGSSGQVKAGSNDWGSATPSQYEADKASNSNNEGRVAQHFEHQLAGWDGNWAPPPIEWDARPAFDNKDPDYKGQLEDWMATVVANGTKTVDVAQASFADGTAHTCITEEGELRLVIPPEAPDAPLDRSDPDSVKNRMQTAESSALKSSNRALIHEKETKRRNKEQREQIAERQANYVPPPNPHAPKARIYLRPATVADFKQIVELYRFYIEKTVYVPEREYISEYVMIQRFQHVRNTKFPWLVAVEPSQVGGRRIEKVVGYGFTEDFNDCRGSYKYTAELEIYVDPRYYQLGVGKCLMDKLMSCLDPTYMPRGGYKFWAGDHDNEYCEGGRRVIRNVLVNLPYDVKDNKTVKWVGEWMGQWEFRRVGTLEAIGFKLDKL